MKRLPDFDLKLCYQWPLKIFIFWDIIKQRIDMPEDLRAPAELVPIVQVKSLWIMRKEVGITLECTDLMCLIPESTCPFAEDNPFN